MNSNAQPPLRTGLLDFFKNSSGSQFVIPVYQRSYTWTSGKEVKQYLEDLASLLKGEYTNHFLGIIIYLDKPIDFSSREFSVIDGQQRLTTTFLILYAIRSIMKDQNANEDIKSLDGQFLTNPFSSNNKLKYKLKPLVSDDNVYQYIVSDSIDDIEDKSSKVYNNYFYILEYIKELSKEYSYNDILMALNKLYVVCIPLSENDNAQKIFESINSTGVKLTASDLIRNFLLMDLPSDLQEKYYENYWVELEKYLGDDAKKLESFFRFYLSIKLKTLPNKNEVYRSFISWYKNNETSMGREGIFKDIIKFAKYYYNIYHNNIGNLDDELKKPIEEFRRILSDMPAPLMMGFMDLYHNGKITAEQLSELIFIINSYLIRRALCDLDTSSISRMFPPLLKDVMEECGGNYDNIVDVLKKNLVFKNKNNGMYVPDDKQLEDIITNANMYKIKSTLRIFLDKLEHYNNPARVDLETLNIEHLMPQTPTDEWYTNLGVDKEEYQRNVNRLGNLTLAAKIDNSKMQNKVWSYKNEILSNTSHLTINKEILEKEKWTISEIEKRTKSLIQSINKLFPYPQASSSIIHTEEIYIKLEDKIIAQAKFYVDTGAVEIYEGSELCELDNLEKYSDLDQERQNLLDDGIIFDDNGRLVFKRAYTIYSKKINETALSSSAKLILGGSRNGWVEWRDKNGKKIDSFRVK
ncbi:DUF4357 domain-containing protein [Peptoniphilus duerdenii]|uniref:DUF4357 domain-containing protein n=1 Tax=Peptoniphilus duerdenii TaxID=507750 RepID=UPI00288AA602|nr:DUF4357 domain-containing protein [Peptoniphilus duerdenii]